MGCPEDVSENPEPVPVLWTQGLYLEDSVDPVFLNAVNMFVWLFLASADFSELPSWQVGHSQLLSVTSDASTLWMTLIVSQGF